jgi:hypothetical protein
VTFRPSTHGFRFGNSFSQLPQPSHPSFPTLPPLSQGYGLCGGMSLDARDRYLAGQSIPTRTSVPAAGTALFNRLWSKQLESFGFAWRYVGQFAVWMALPDGGTSGVRKRTFDHWPRVRAQLNKNRPTVLGLVRVRAQSNLRIWENHQVLAYRYRIPQTNHVHVFVYDPNNPQEDNVRIELRRVQVGTRLNWRLQQVPVYGYIAEQRFDNNSTMDCRGFFRMTS